MGIESQKMPSSEKGAQPEKDLLNIDLLKGVRNEANDRKLKDLLGDNYHKQTLEMIILGIGYDQAIKELEEMNALASDPNNSISVLLNNPESRKLAIEQWYRITLARMDKWGEFSDGG